MRVRQGRQPWTCREIVDASSAETVPSLKAASDVRLGHDTEPILLELLFQVGGHPGGPGRADLDPLALLGELAGATEQRRRL
jgi:hypothetical protein